MKKMYKESNNPCKDCFKSDDIDIKEISYGSDIKEIRRKKKYTLDWEVFERNVLFPLVIAFFIIAFLYASHSDYETFLVLRGLK